MEEKHKKASVIFVVLIIILSSIIVVATRYESENAEKKHSLFVKILADEYTGVYPHEVIFYPLVINSKGNLKYHWDFGDGETSNEEKTMHIYESMGSYICTLTVADSDEENLDSVNITVLQNNPPLVKIITDKTTGFRPEIISFNADAFDVDGDDLTYEWKIKYPPSILAGERITTYDEKNFSVRFLRPGMYVVTLTVADEAGNSVTEYLRIDMKASKIEVAFGSLLYLLSITQAVITVIRFLMNNTSSNYIVPFL